MLTRCSTGFPNSLLTCKLCRTFRKSFIPVRCSTSWKTATSRVGMMAIDRVRITRAKRDHFRFRNPWKEAWKLVTICDRRERCLGKSGTLRSMGLDTPSCASSLYFTPASTHLHDKLARIGSGHGGALTGSQDPHCPDVESCRPEVTSKHNTLGEGGRDRLVSDLLR